MCCRNGQLLSIIREALRACLCLFLITIFCNSLLAIFSWRFSLPIITSSRFALFRTYTEKRTIISSKCETLKITIDREQSPGSICITKVQQEVPAHR